MMRGGCTFADEGREGDCVVVIEERADHQVCSGRIYHLCSVGAADLPPVGAHKEGISLWEQPLQYSLGPSEVKLFMHDIPKHVHAFLDFLDLLLSAEVRMMGTHERIPPHISGCTAKESNMTCNDASLYLSIILTTFAGMDTAELFQGL